MFGRRPHSNQARICVFGFSANRVWLVSRFYILNFFFTITTKRERSLIRTAQSDAVRCCPMQSDAVRCSPMQSDAVRCPMQFHYLFIYLQQLNKYVVYTHIHTEKNTFCHLPWAPKSLKLIKEGPLLRSCLYK